MKDRTIFNIIIPLGLAFLLVSLLVLSSLNLHNLISSPLSLSEPVLFAMIIMLFITIPVLLILTKNIYLLSKQQKTLEIQDFYIEHLSELVRAIRVQRHDFVNHMQVVYALMKTGKFDKAIEYIADLSHDIQITGAMLSVDIPELSALLLAKTDLARKKEILFKITVESNLKGLEIKPLELIMVVANLLDNAFEAVESLPVDIRSVVLKVAETAEYYSLQINNPGYIPEEIRMRMFEMGYSTKEGKERGTGLAAVKSVVEKNGGTITLQCSRDQGIIFTVCFPKPSNS
ncbi:MAG: sensor histidine kinase [Thermacetogeniaceae bacterium]|jgi:sensor histidine kinase regulating citrate/malate metabolism|nr:Spo0B domain-containing protein [Thermoanaerobacterales bacterium]